MNDEAESSRAGQRYNADASTLDAEEALYNTRADEEQGIPRCEQTIRDRRVDAKRKRIISLDHLLRDLDSIVFLELITIYYMDCSFFWFAVRCIVHVSLLTPLPDLAIARQHDEHKPFLALILVSFSITFLLHLICAAPSAGEDTRGYLHGGLMIDFIGQQGPTSKWRLAFLDIGVLVLQLVMVSVFVKRRDLKKRLAKAAEGTSGSTSTEGEGEPEVSQAGTVETNANPEQDADAEERGVLRRTDTFSDIGAEMDEENALLPIPPTGHADALDMLASGQCVIGDFHVIETLLQEHENYETYRQTRTEPRATTSLAPTALRRLNSFRVRFGVGGG